MVIVLVNSVRYIMVTFAAEQQLFRTLREFTVWAGPNTSWRCIADTTCSQGDLQIFGREKFFP